VPASRLETKARELLGLIVSQNAANDVVARLMALETVADTRAMLPELAAAPTRAMAAE
jgi:hypothetical protein